MLFSVIPELGVAQHLSRESLHETLINEGCMWMQIVARSTDREGLYRNHDVSAK